MKTAVLTRMPVEIIKLTKLDIAVAGRALARGEVSWSLPKVANKPKSLL